jgi:hypothetical protein
MWDRLICRKYVTVEVNIYMPLITNDWNTPNKNGLKNKKISLCCLQEAWRQRLENEIGH